MERRLQDGSVSGMALFGHRTLIAWSDDHRTDQFQARLFLATTTREHWSGTWRNAYAGSWILHLWGSAGCLANDLGSSSESFRFCMLVLSLR